MREHERATLRAGRREDTGDLTFSGRALDQKTRRTLKVDERLGKKRDAAQEGVRLAEQKKMAQRLWAKDAKLWGDDPKHQEVAKNRLGWVEVAGKMRKELPAMTSFAKEASQRFRHCERRGEMPDRPSGCDQAPKLSVFRHDHERC